MGVDDDEQAQRRERLDALKELSARLKRERSALANKSVSKEARRVHGNRLSGSASDLSGPAGAGSPRAGVHCARNSSGRDSGSPKISASSSTNSRRANSPSVPSPRIRGSGRIKASNGAEGISEGGFRPKNLQRTSMRSAGGAAASPRRLQRVPSDGSAGSPRARASGSFGTRRRSSGILELDVEEQPIPEFSSAVKLGKYQLGEKIGSGAFGTVYKAMDSETGNFVAVKQLLLAGVPSKVIEAIVNEVELLESLDNPHIVTYLDLLQTDYHLNIVLEYVDSGSLRSVLEKFGHLSERLASRYVDQILDGLEFLHEELVIHRDIKTSNILVSNSGQVLLSDFGLAALDPKRAGSSSQPVGSAYYMAPEVIKGHGAVFRSDIWSLGCTVIELVTGEPPYGELDEEEAMTQMCADEHPPFPPNASGELRDFLRRCFARRPDERPSPSILRSHPWIRRNARGDSDVESVRSDASGRSADSRDEAQEDTEDAKPWPKPRPRLRRSKSVGISRTIRHQHSTSLTDCRARVLEHMKDADAWSDLGHCFFRKGLHSEALQSYEQAALLAPRDPLKYLHIGYLWEKLGHWPEAEMFYRRCIFLSPYFHAALLALSNALEHQERFDEANEIKMSLDPNQPSTTRPMSRNSHRDDTGSIASGASSGSRRSFGAATPSVAERMDSRQQLL